jgi:hypothetical protein
MFNTSPRAVPTADSNIPADDLTCVSGYASFTITGLGRYAVAGFPPPAWKVDADGVWQNAANWTTEPNAPGGVNVAAVLGPAITLPRTVTFTGPLTLGVLTLDTAQHYTLAGTDALTLQANPGYSAKIEVQASDANGQVIATPVTLASPLEISIAPSALLTLAGQVQNPAGQSLTLSGGGTLHIAQGLSSTGMVNVREGALNLPSLTAGSLTIGQAPGAAAVPEPSVCALLLAGLIGGFFMRQRMNFSQRIAGS